jgi:hypothetical protein
VRLAVAAELSNAVDEDGGLKRPPERRLQPGLAAPQEIVASRFMDVKGA